MDDGGAFRLNTDRDAGAAQAVAFHCHEGDVRRLKAADHPGFDAFFLNAGDHFAQNIFMRNADDIGGLRQTKRWPDGNNDFILLRAGLASPISVRKLSPDTGATATGAAEATEAAGALRRPAYLRLISSPTAPLR